MSRISAFGVYAPERIVDNHYFEELVNTNDEWITSRTGIRTRRFSKEQEYTSDLCVKAVQNLVQNSGIRINDVDFILVCTTSPDQTMPNTASRVQHKLEIENAGCNDIYAACAGFVYGLQIAHGFVNANVYQKVLVIGAETLTKITDFEDRTSCILFGDGAGAALVEPGDEEHFIAFSSGTHSEYGNDLYLSNKKKSINSVAISPNGKIVQNGRTIFKWAVNYIPARIQALINKAGLSMDAIDLIIPHSANLRIIEAIAGKLNYPLERMPESVTEFGNTSSASIPLAIDKAIKNGKINPGSLLLMIGFGGGLTFAGTIVRW